MVEKNDITMEKDKNLLIFTNKNFPYKISFDLNSGKYFKILPDKQKELKSINFYFTNHYYKDIIKQEDFPVYYKMIEMAADRGWNLRNMGSVLSFLRHNLCWEQYLVLNIPIDNSVNFPLSIFPKDVLNAILRAIKLNNMSEYRYLTRGWHSKYTLPDVIDNNFNRMNANPDFFNCIRYISQFKDDLDFIQRFSIICCQYHRVLDIIKNFHYEYKSLIEYICFLEDYEGYERDSEAIQDLYDYADMSAKLAEMCDRKGKFEKYPHFLKSRHHIVARNFNIIKEERKEELFTRMYKGELAYSYGKYCIIEPTSTKDILKEAQEMHNCVASYIDKVIDGKTHIVFMRERKSINDSLVTVEVKNGHICQAFQKNNVVITEEQRKFLQNYAKNKKFILDNI